MGRLIEARVQEYAQNFLENRYKKKARGNLFSRIEVRTRKKYGGKRADGFLAFKRFLWGTYVVSMEAKSYKTLPAMIPYTDDKRFVLNTLWMGFLICVFSGAFFFLFKRDDSLWQFLVPINTFIVSAVAYAIITRKSFRHKTVDVIHQLYQYPANEQWLAFSQDSLSAIPIDKQRNLETLAKYHGVGIVIVHSEKRVEMLCKPKKRIKWGKGDFLKYYSIEDEVRKFIAI